MKVEITLQDGTQVAGQIDEISTSRVHVDGQWLDRNDVATWRFWDADRSAVDKTEAAIVLAAVAVVVVGFILMMKYLEDELSGL